MTFLGIRVKNPRVYNLIIEYKAQDSTTLAPTYTLPLPFGATYSVPSPEIEGYTVSDRQQVISGTMPARSVQYTVIYLPNNTVEIDPINGEIS